LRTFKHAYATIAVHFSSQFALRALRRGAVETDREVAGMEQEQQAQYEEYLYKGFYILVGNGYSPPPSVIDMVPPKNSVISLAIADNKIAYIIVFKEIDKKNAS
jgi:hypothetical protein